MSEKINIDRILLEFEKLPHFQERIALQTVEGKDHVYGSLSRKDIHHDPDDFTHFCFPELEYTNSIITKLNLYRTRVMKLKPKTCYSYHRDMTMRIHIPLITNSGCMLIVNDEVKKLPADGNWYLIDTTKRHTAINASLKERIHIVGCVNT